MYFCLHETKKVSCHKFWSLRFLETDSETDCIHPDSGEEGRIIAHTSLNISLAPTEF